MTLALLFLHSQKAFSLKENADLVEICLRKYKEFHDISKLIAKYLRTKENCEQ